MNQTNITECLDNDLYINVKAKKCPSDQNEHGSTPKIQSLDIEFDEDYSGNSEIFELKIRIKRKIMINADA